MLRFKIQSTDEYERLVKFFVENELEFDGDEEVDTDIVKCWKVTHGEDVLIGGCVLAMRQGRYIIDGIAVDKLFPQIWHWKDNGRKSCKRNKRKRRKRAFPGGKGPGLFQNAGI